MHKEDRASVEGKLKKAADLYKSQKEVLEMQLGSCESEERESVLRAFEDEFGELA
jgi:hypothetical protein